MNEVKVYKTIVLKLPYLRALSAIFVGLLLRELLLSLLL
jgi:hypothetical protein